jgi:hypothetical protein
MTGGAPLGASSRRRADWSRWGRGRPGRAITSSRSSSTGPVRGYGCFGVGDVVERGVAVVSIAGDRAVLDDEGRAITLRLAHLEARAGRSLGRATPFDRAADRAHDYFASAVLSS